MAQCSTDIIEAWLHKWEEAFAICEIRADMKKNCEAMHMFAEAADWWWIKEQCDEVAATTWEGFKIEFKKHFLPLDASSQAGDQYRNLRQRNLFVGEYIDKFRDFIYELDEKIKREVHAKYVTFFDEAVAVALNYEDARGGKPSGFFQIGIQQGYQKKVGFQKKWIAKSNAPQSSGRTKQGKPSGVTKKPSTTVGVKCKVTPMVVRALTKSSLTLEQKEKVRREGKIVHVVKIVAWQT